MANLKHGVFLVTLCVVAIKKVNRTLVVDPIPRSGSKEHIATIGILADFLSYKGPDWN